VEERAKQIEEDIKKKEAVVEEKNKQSEEELKEVVNRHDNRNIIVDAYKTAIGNVRRFMEVED
jgi:deoxycytidine triphosphate deaminase